jgi:hypothetical protein
MSYLLPCPACGNKLSVVMGQAGQIVHCACGADVEVPTIRGLRELEQVSDEPIGASRWTTRHSVAFLGLLILAGALAFSLYLHLRAPIFDPSGYEQEVQAASPEQSWEHWMGNLRLGPRMRVRQAEHDAITRRAVKDQYVERWEWVGYGVAALGLVIALAGWFGLRPRTIQGSTTKVQSRV